MSRLARGPPVGDSGVSVLCVIPLEGHCPNSTPRGRLRERGIAHRRVTGAEEKDALESRGLEAVALVLAQRGVFDRHRARPVVADEEDRATSLIGVIVFDDR